MSAIPDRVSLDDFNEIPAFASQKKPRHSWIPNSLIQLDQNPPAPPTIGGLLYPGKRTLLSGETESLKTWLALILAKAEIQVEQPVAWVDLDDMGAGAILQRLRALQISDEQIHDHFLYYQPDQRLYDTRDQKRTEILNDVLAQLTTSGTRLMIIDAFNPVLTLHGLDPNSVTDIETFWQEIAAPIAKTGAAPVLLDHVVKNSESRGKYSSGSERKASGCTVHIGMHTLETLVVGGMGRAVLTTHKDRPAYLPRPTIGILKLESIQNPNGEEIQYQLEADISHTTGGFRPTILMERISSQLRDLDRPVTQNWVETNVSGEAKPLRLALETLVAEGYINREVGPRNSLQHLLLKPYSADVDPLLHDPDPDRVLTASNRVPELVSSPTASASHPLGGDAVDAVGERPKTQSTTSTQNGALPEDAGPPDEDPYQ